MVCEQLKDKELCMTEIDDICRSREFHQKYENRFTVGISILPSRDDRFQIIDDHFQIIIVGRPPSRYSKSQGNHTFALSAIYRSLEWQFKECNHDNIKEKIMMIHDNLVIMYHYSLASHDTLMQGATNAYKKITTNCSKDMMILPWVVEYLTLYVYVANLLPEAAFIMDKNSGNRGEGTALAEIKNLEKRGFAKKEEIIKKFSLLFDPSAIDCSIKTLSIDQVVVYQLVSLHSILQNTPKLKKILFGEYGDQSILNLGLCNKIIPSSLVSDLHQIIFSRAQASYKENIERGLDRISKIATKYLIGSNGWLRPPFIKF